MTPNQPHSSLLLVDDQRVMRDLVIRLCRHTTWSVVGCLDTATAWERLRAEPFDLVLLDLNLPGEPGEQLCRRVRNDPDLAPLPVALFTDWGIPTHILAGLEAGADFIVAKELVSHPEAWLTRLGEILGRVRGQPRPWFLQYREHPGRTVRPEDGVGGVVWALRHPSLRDVPPEILSWVLRRAWTEALSTPVPSNLDAWLLPGLPVPAPPGSLLPPEDLRALAVALAQRVWCLLGTTASAPFRAALAGTFPGASELLQP